MKAFIKVAMVLWFIQVKCLAFTQTVANGASSYIFTFSPVYSSSLVDMDFIAFEELYLIVSYKPLKIDSVMSELSRKNYSTKQGILDTLKKEFKVYIVIENDSKSKTGNRVNKILTNSNHYRTGYMFSLNETIKKSSSLVGFVIRRYTPFEKRVKYRVLNEICGDFPNECRAMITSL